MSESKFEAISSLVDNYTSSTDVTIAEHIIDNMLLDEDLSKTWQNYHLIGDVMRDEMPQSLQLDLSKQIAEVIDAEPTVLAPSSDKKVALPVSTQGSTSQDNTSQVNTSKDNVITFKSRVAAFIKPIGQVAIAASAAGLMILGVQQNTANNDTVLPSQVVQTKPLAGYANPVSYNVQSSVENQRTNQEMLMEKRIEKQRRFQALLNDHQQQIKFIGAIKKQENIN
ncbi:MAG: RseA family anti-sigma factor [Colwellia sp.]